MKLNSRIYIFIAISICGIALICGGLRYQSKVDQQQFARESIVARCVGLNSSTVGLTDCYGVISLWWDEDGGLDVQNNLSPGGFVAKINSNSDFRVDGDRIYLIERRRPEVCNNLIPGKYCGNYFIAGKNVSSYYDSAEEVPRYLSIDTRTGNEMFYVKIKEAPETEQEIFRQLDEKI